MILNTDSLIYLLLFIGVLLFVEGVYYLMRDARERGERGINKRLQMIKESGDVRAALRKYRLGDQDAPDNRLARILPAISRLLIQSGSSAQPGRALITMAALAIVAAIISQIGASFPGFVDLLIGLGVGTALPILLLRRKRKKRIARFGEQLPDAIDLIVRALQAGHPTSAALGLVAREMPDPIGTEFGLAVDEMTYGRDMAEAMTNMLSRMPHPDLNFLVATVEIQRATGGNLAEVLANLANVIRERFRMFAKARAVSAEGRLSGIVVGLLPPLVAVILNVIDPNYFRAVMGDPIFWPMMGLGGLFVLGGWFVIRRMVNIKV